MAAGTDELCRLASLLEEEDDDPLWDPTHVAAPFGLLPEEPEGIPGLDELLRGLLPDDVAAAAPPQRLLSDGAEDDACASPEAGDSVEVGVDVHATYRSEDELAVQPGSADDERAEEELEDDVLDDGEEDFLPETPDVPPSLPRESEVQLAAQTRRSSFEEDFHPETPDVRPETASSAQHAQQGPPVEERPTAAEAARPPPGPPPERPSPRAALALGPHVAVTEAPTAPSTPSRCAPMSPTASMTASISSRSRAKWRESTQEKLASAKALTTEVFKSLLAEELGQVGKVGIGEKTQQVNLTIKRKIAATEDMTKTLEDRISKVEDSIRQAGECMFQLQRAHRAKSAPLSVCERRLELRAARPEQERLVDQCQAALEAERRTLVDSREELLRLAGACAQSLLRLDAVKGELRRDLQARRQSLRMDRGCISARKPISGPGSPSPGWERQRVVLPTLQATQRGQPASARGPGTPADAGALLAKAVRAEEDSLRLCTESDAAMGRSHRECGGAAAKTQASLQHRIQETSSLKKNLEAQKTETEEAIAKTELALAKNRKNLEAYEQPLRAVTAQLATDDGGTARGSKEPLGHHRRDLEGQLELLQQGAREVEGKCRAGEELLERLRASKGQTLEDLRCKAAAKAIDDNCMKVNARKALGLDASSLPSASSRSTRVKCFASAPAGA